MNQFMQNPDVLVLGAGIAGLYSALRLAEQGKKVLVIEKESEPGGLCRTLHMDKFSYDIGGHRIYIKNESIKELVLEMLGKKALIKKRNSTILLNGRYFSYPPKARDILRLPISMISSIAISYFYGKLKPISKERTDLEAWIIRKYGSAMYNLYFKPYSEKVWGMPCSHISADWAKQRIGNTSLLKDFFSIFRPNKQNTKENTDYFIYPKDGIASVANALLEKFEKLGGKVIFSSDINSIDLEVGNIKSIVTKSNGKSMTFFPKQVLSTIPMTEFVSLLKPKNKEIIEQSSKIKYRDLIVIFLTFTKPKIIESQWIHFPDKDILFSRMHEPKNWSTQMSPEGKSSLCIEIVCADDSPLWTASDEDLKDKSVEQLIKLGIISKGDLDQGKVDRFRYAYPMFYQGYASPLKSVKDFIAGIKNLTCLGRQGSHIYSDIEECFKEVEAKIQ